MEQRLAGERELQTLKLWFPKWWGRWGTVGRLIREDGGQSGQYEMMEEDS